MEQSQGWRPEDHLGILGLWKPRPERIWKRQEGSFMSLRVYSEILLKLWWENLFLLEVNQGSWGIVCGETRCLCGESSKRRMWKVPGCGEAYSFRERLRGQWWADLSNWRFDLFVLVAFVFVLITLGSLGIWIYSEIQTFSVFALWLVGLIGLCCIFPLNNRVLHETKSSVIFFWLGQTFKNYAEVFPYLPFISQTHLALWNRLVTSVCWDQFQIATFPVIQFKSVGHI